MADVVTNSENLLIETLFNDGDTRTLTLRNPTDEITMNDINTFNVFLQTSGILVGDRNGAEFSKIKQVKRRNSATVKLDLGS